MRKPTSVSSSPPENLRTELALCHLWLRRFRFGPLEWVWRSAVYLKPQPMRMP